MIEKTRLRSTCTMPLPGSGSIEKIAEDRRDADGGDEVAVADLLDRDDRRFDARAQVDGKRVVEQAGEVFVQRAKRLQLIVAELVQPLVEAEIERLDASSVDRFFCRRTALPRELIDECVNFFLRKTRHVRTFYCPFSAFEIVALSNTMSTRRFCWRSFIRSCSALRGLILSIACRGDPGRGRSSCSTR